MHGSAPFHITVQVPPHPPAVTAATHPATTDGVALAVVPAPGAAGAGAAPAVQAAGVEARGGATEAAVAGAEAMTRMEATTTGGVRSNHPCC